MTIESSGALINSILVGVAGLLGGGLVLRRRLSKDNTEISKDRAESGLVSRLQTERDNAQMELKVMRDQHTLDVREIAKLTAERDMLQRDVSLLTKDFAVIKKTVKRLSPELQKYLGTDFSDLDPRG